MDEIIICIDDIDLIYCMNNFIKDKISENGIWVISIDDFIKICKEECDCKYEKQAMRILLIMSKMYNAYQNALGDFVFQSRV